MIKSLLEWELVCLQIRRLARERIFGLNWTNLYYNGLEVLFVCSQSKFEAIFIVCNWYSTDLAENDWNLPIKNHVEYVWHFNFGSVDNFGEVLFVSLPLYNVYHSHKTDNFFWNVQNLFELCVILHAFCVFHLSSKRNFDRKRNWKHYNSYEWNILFGTCKSLSEALLFAEHEENMLCTKIVLNVRSNFCTRHVLPRLELGIFM